MVYLASLAEGSLLGLSLRKLWAGNSKGRGVPVGLEQECGIYMGMAQEGPRGHVSGREPEDVTRPASLEGS